MPASPSRRHGLRLQLTLFYIALSVPALLLIEQSILGFEFQRCLTQLDDGRVERVLQREAADLQAALARGIAAPEIDQRLRRFVLELERPRESLGTKAAYVLLELAPHPFAATLTTGSAGPTAAVGRDMVHRRWTAPLAVGDQVLTLDLLVPSPWRHFGRSLSFEWPIAASYLVLFLIGSAWFLRRRVLTRVARIDAAAQAWARGDFAPHLADDSSDELGQLARDLNRMAADLQALFATRSQLATLEERRRLARDLHDTVKQKVFALSLQLAAARESGDPARLQLRLAEASALVEEIQRELSDQLRELREDAGAAEDLVPALQRRLEDFARRSGRAVDPDLPEHLNLAPAQTETLLRIVDESLANIWRHSEADRVRVSVRRQDRFLELTIADNGRGGARESASGMGLTNMRQRANSLPGAEFSIHSPEDGGTLVRLQFDLEDR
ncbi:MAG TPA: sensor histidine kinase [Xanthomonadales bacterium]|nr:sensor histidine kinase [Xanthomonadales bacterium]